MQNSLASLGKAAGVASNAGHPVICPRRARDPLELTMGPRPRGDPARPAYFTQAQHTDGMPALLERKLGLAIRGRPMR